MAEAGHEHDAVGDVEIRVAGGQALALAFDAAGRRQLNDVPGSARRVAHGGEPRAVLAQQGVILVRRIVFHDRHQRGGIDETGQVVDVPVGVVADDPLAEPEDLLHAEIIAQVRFDLRTVHFRVAVRVEQAGLRGQQRPGAVHLDGTALQDHRRREEREVEQLRDVLRHFVVQVAGWIFSAPRVVAPIDHGEALRVAHEDGPVVAAPWLVGGKGMEMNARAERCVGLF
jgi:hypothetical protein